MTRRVFVTGAAGFIGGSIARVLRERGDEVVAVVRDASKTGDLVDIGAQVVRRRPVRESAVRDGDDRL